MPDSTSTINKLIACIKSNPFESSKISRNSQRASAGSQILGSSVEFLAPAAMIPTKLAQALLSGQTIFRAETSTPERLLHFFLCAIPLTQLTLQSILLFQNDECQDTKQAICRGLFFLGLLYAGFLLTGWGSSEASKASNPINNNDTPPLQALTPTTLIATQAETPSLLKKVKGCFTGYSFKSSKVSRKAQRASAGAQVLGSSFQFLTPAAVIPSKISQVLFSGHAMLNQQSTRRERVLNGTLCAVSLSELTLHTLLLFQNYQCHDTKKSICQAILYLGLVYSGLLATGWIPSEASKGDTGTMNTQPVNNVVPDESADEESEAPHFFEMESPV